MIDLPPVWLAAFAMLAWLQKTYLSVGWTFETGWVDWVGGAFLAAGALLVLAAVVEFRRHKTTIIPHRDASALITSGIYGYTRNPIYLADVLILTGLVLIWNAVLSLALIPILIWLLELRFIVPEEDRLHAKFPEAFASYAYTVRRWA